MNTLHQDTNKTRHLSHCADFYDKYAGALYGIILRAVNKEIVAEKIFIKVFRDAVYERKIETSKFLSEFTCVSNHARKISQVTVKAINMFEACNEGRDCMILSKQK
jgi:hypothetical protein